MSWRACRNCRVSICPVKPPPPDAWQWAVPLPARSAPFSTVDWFAVDLVAGRSYVIDLRGSGTDGSSLRDPLLNGVYGNDGALIAGTRDDDAGHGLHSRVTFTATESATHYVSVGAHLTGAGTYELEVTDTTDDPASDEAFDDFAAGTATTGALVPNSDTGVALGYGDIDSGGDVDWFAIELEADQSVTFRLTGYNPETRSYFGGMQNPQIKGIYDADGHLLPDTSTSDPRAWQTFGEDSRILGFQNLGGSQWQEARLVFKATEAGTYYVAAGSLQSAQTGKYTLAVSPGPAADDFSDDTQTEGEVAVGGSVQGNIEWEDDVDWFAVELTADVRYEFELAGPDNSREYPVFGKYVWDSAGNPYAAWRSASDSTTDRGNTINQGFFTPEADGTYYIPVKGGSYDSFWSGNSTLNEYWDAALTYTLSVAEAEDQPQPSADDYPADTSTTGEVEVDGDPVGGELARAGDVDWFAVELVADKTYVFIQRGSFGSEENTLRWPSIVGLYDDEGERDRRYREFQRVRQLRWGTCGLRGRRDRHPLHRGGLGKPGGKYRDLYGRGTRGRHRLGCGRQHDHQDDDRENGVVQGRARRLETLHRDRGRGRCGCRCRAVQDRGIRYRRRPARYVVVRRL